MSYKLQQLSLLLLLSACGSAKPSTRASAASNDAPAAAVSPTPAAQAAASTASPTPSATGTAIGVSTSPLQNPTNVYVTGSDMTSYSLLWNLPTVAVAESLGEGKAAAVVNTLAAITPGGTPPATCAAGQVSTTKTFTFASLAATSQFSYRLCTLVGAAANSAGALISTGVTGTFWTLAAPSLTDAGFETPSMGAGGYGNIPVGYAWAQGAVFAASNSGFGVGTAPEGNQVLVLQSLDSTSQSIASMDPTGSYRILWQSGQRSGSAQDYNVTYDANTWHFQPIDTSYRYYASGIFSPAATAGTLGLIGVDTVTGDNSAFLDDIHFRRLATVQPQNNSFEAPALAAGTVGSSPTGWTSNAVLVSNGSTYTAAATTEGTQAIALEMTDYISQSIAGWPAGNFQILLYAAQQSGGARQDLRLLIDGSEVWRTSPLDTNFSLYLSAPFIVTAGTHVVRLEGLDSAGGDLAALIDRIEIFQY